MFKASYERVDKVKTEIATLMGSLQRFMLMIASYESENVKMSTMSGYNGRRKRLRERRGGNTSGPPREAMRGTVDGKVDGAVSDGAGDGEEAEDDGSVGEAP